MPDITTVLLIKDGAIVQSSLDEYYLDLLAKEGIPKNEVLALPLLYNNPKKVLAKTGKAYLDKLVAKIPATVTRLIIADGNYFKFITKVQKISSKYGITVQGAYPGYTHLECVYVPNYRSLFKQPENANLIDIGIKTLAGTNNTVTIKHAEYGFKYGSDRDILDSLHKHPVLTADIETTGLSLEDAIVSIAFAWSKHDGVAIDISISGEYYLRKFFESYKGKLIFHGGLFDIKLLVRRLWMKDPTDYAGMLEGIHYFRDADDTMLLTYVAKNATTQVALGLKEAALEYVGNFAIDITDVTKYTKQEVLEYNLIDALGTFYLWEKYHEELTSRVYTEILQPSMYPIIKMMIVGLPLDSDKVEEVHKVFVAQAATLQEQIRLNPHVIEFNKLLQEAACIAANAKLKKLVKPIEMFRDIEFNPNSGPQKIKLFFEMLGLPVLDRTKTGAPATGADVFKDLQNHTTDQDIIDLLDFIVRFEDIGKIDGTFIKAFMVEKGVVHGNLKLGGTQSGRLSSNEPNLTNLPAHGPMGKLVKSCVRAPAGWLFCSADFAALEEKVGAILSNDPNRIKVYKDGFDGHSLRAHRYFAKQMPDIVSKLDKLNLAGKFYKVTADDGSVEYYHECELDTAHRHLLSSC